MNSRNKAFLLAFSAMLIYGVSFTIAKEVMPKHLQPFGFILLRVAGACTIFWSIGFSIRSEKIAYADYPRLILASVFGIALNQLAFFKGLSLTSPISASVIMVTSPILVMSFSALLLKEPITVKKIGGILIGLVGAVVLIGFSQPASNASNAFLGNSLVFLNAASYSLYLILIKRLTDRYHPITLAKWLYLFGLVMVVPFGYSELLEANWSGFDLSIWWRIGFIVVFTSALTYLFNLFAIRKLKPTTLSIFIYLQPVIASIYALLVGSDQLSVVKVLATLLIFAGVYLVTRKPKEA